MAVTNEQPAPYATISSILEIIHRYRKRGMHIPFTGDVLGRAGVSDSLIPRTIQSLIGLDLITEEGTPTDILEGIRACQTGEYKDCLAGWLKCTYADVFSFVDPTVDDEIKIRDAFRTYEPKSQQDRMVKLFIGLCEEAGLREKPTTTKSTTQKRKISATGRRKSRKPATGSINTGTLPPALAGLLEQLPSGKGCWSQEQFDEFSATFNSVLKFCYKIKETNDKEINSDEETL